MKDRETIVAWLGLDWADEKHWVCLQEVGREGVERFCLDQKPELLHERMRELRQRFGGRQVAVVVEENRGPLLYALMQYDFLVLYPIAPKALSSYRKTWRLSGAKDDPKDAELLLRFALTHREYLTAWEAEEAPTRRLRTWVEQRRKLVEEKTRTTNRLKQQLKEYFPQVLEWFSEVDSALVLDFLSDWPSLQQVQRARRSTLERFFQRHHCRRERTQQRLEWIARGVALTDDPVVLETHPLVVRLYVEQLRLLGRQIEELEEEIEKVSERHEDQAIFASFPGAGRQLAPRLVVAFGTDRDRFDAYRMKCFSGIAPVTEQSGKSRWVHHRFVCAKFLKQTFHEFAQYSIPHSAWANAYYHQQRERGASQHEAIRALAAKWIPILTRCWKERTAYREEIYLEALRRSGSPLIERIEAVAA